MSRMVRIKCQSCRKSFHRNQEDLDFVDEPPVPAYYKVKCPLCSFENKIDVIQNHKGKAAMYEVGMVFYYTINIATFVGMTPQGILSAIFLVGSIFLIFRNPIIGIPLALLLLAVTIFLFRVWMKGDVDPQDFVGP